MTKKPARRARDGRRVGNVRDAEAPRDARQAGRGERGREGSRDGSSSAPSATPGVASEASGVAPVDKPAGSATFSRAELAAMGLDVGDRHGAEGELPADGEFVEVFGMERGAFESMPLWKRQAAKKKAGLFNL